MVGPLRAPSRGPQPRWVHCSIVAAILGHGSRGAVRAISGKAHFKGGVLRSPTEPDAFRPPLLNFWDLRLQLWQDSCNESDFSLAYA
ncbi:hypothetical protein NDU88_006452 [Pleurodeles waltl]|uniref:Uncharacterized protein n=1 Tax=Pleurodeles waltl TaxID=8319 RepID=A0AAV7VLY7_PLEWA|nr:hypothetical protein NDU88_006452 [Pleurodeles waltl]